MKTEKTEKKAKKTEILKCRVTKEVADFYKQRSIEQGTTVSSLLRYQLQMPQKQQ